MALSPFMISADRGQSCPWQYILAVWTFFVHPRTFLSPRHGPWAWYEMGQGRQFLWPHNNPSKSCCPAHQAGRRILMFSGLCHGQSGLVLLLVPGPLRLPKARSYRFGVRGALSLILFKGWCGSLRYKGCTFNGAFMKRRGFSSWGFPWELDGIYFTWNSLFGLCAR